MRTALLALVLAAAAGCAARDRAAERAAAGGSAGAGPAAERTDGDRPDGEQPDARPPAPPPPRRPHLLRDPPPPPGPPDGAAAAAIGSACPEQGCPAGTVCLEYCGVAGCRPGFVFRTCEIPCKTAGQCPPGFTCGKVADGPGRVCLGGGGRWPPPRPGGGEVK